MRPAAPPAPSAAIPDIAALETRRGHRPHGRAAAEDAGSRCNTRRAGRNARLRHLLAGTGGRRAAGRGLAGCAARVLPRDDRPRLDRSRPGLVHSARRVAHAAVPSARRNDRDSGMDGFYAARLRRTSAELSHPVFPQHSSAAALCRLRAPSYAIGMDDASDAASPPARRSARQWRGPRAARSHLARLRRSPCCAGGIVRPRPRSC